MIWPYIAISIILFAGVIYHDMRLPADGFGSFAYRRISLILFALLTVALILLAGLRFRVGMDSAAVMNTFNYSPSSLSDLADNLQPGPGKERDRILYTVFKSMGLGLWAPQMLCAIMLNLPVAFLIYRNSSRPFIAMGFYMLFAWTQLNFEVMLFGAATGMLIWSLPDIFPSLRGINSRNSRDSRVSDAKKTRWLPFIIKILVGAWFHLSILAMIWLPLLRLPKVRRWVSFNRRWWLTALIGVASTFLLRYLLLHFGSLAGDVSPTGFTDITSDRIVGYYGMLFPPHLNWKGYLQFVILKILLPIGGAWLLNRILSRRLSDVAFDSPELVSFDRTTLLTSFLMIIALMGIMGINMPAFVRLSWYLMPVGAIAGAESLDAVRGVGKSMWWLIVAGCTCLHLYSYQTPARHNTDGRSLDLYVPYSSQVEKRYDARREWTIFVYQQREYFNLLPDSAVYYEEKVAGHEEDFRK